MLMNDALGSFNMLTEKLKARSMMMVPTSDLSDTTDTNACTKTIECVFMRTYLNIPSDR